MFNEYFREQYKPIRNNSSLLNNKKFETVTIDFNIDNNAAIKPICLLDPNKAHSFHKISVCMVKLCLCAASVSKFVHIFFSNNGMSNVF